MCLADSKYKKYKYEAYTVKENIKAERSAIKVAYEKRNKRNSV